MTDIELDDYFKKRSWAVKHSAVELAKRLHVTKQQIYEAKQRYREKYSKFNKIPKILLYDLETTPMVSYHWGRWKVNINPENTLHESVILAYTAKYLFDSKVYSEVLTPEEVKNFDDSRLVQNIWQLINDCDILIAYNGTKADNRWITSRFLCYNLDPPKPYLVVDPCKVFKQQFGFSSNKLDAIAAQLQVGRKISTTFELWKQCLEGNVQALNQMKEYNIQDVFVLEDVYLKVRPYIKGHPNIANILEEDVCPICGSKNIQPVDGYYYTAARKYPLHHCSSCGTTFRKYACREVSK